MSSIFKISKFLFVGFFLFVSVNFVFANNGDEVYEDKSYVHLDKSFYVTGEVMWYKLYLPKALKDKPLTARVLLFNKDKEIDDSFFLKSGGKTYIEGYYKIPFNKTSGVYTMVFAAQNGAYKSVTKLAEILVPIYNDLDNISIKKEDLTVPYREGLEPERGSQDLNISIDLNKDKFKSREEVLANITVTDKNGNPVVANLSVSVTDSELTGAHVIAPNNFVNGETHNLLIYENLDDNLYFPGIYEDANNNPTAANIIGVWSATENRMHFTKSADDGKFFLKMPDFEGTIPAQFLAYNDTSDINVSFDYNVNLSRSGELIYTEGILKYLELSRQRKKIFQIYTTLESNIEPAKTPIEVLEFQPDKEVNLKEYEAFDNLPAFFLEITKAGFQFQKQRGGRYVGKVYNPRQTFDGYYPGEALFIVDGKATMDGHFVANLEYSSVENAQIFSRPKNMRKHFSAMATSGAVVLTTNDPDFQLPNRFEEDIKQINGLQSKAAFPVFNPTDIQNKTRQPFFRPQLYWNPNLNTPESGKTQFSYHQSDDVSIFQIEVVAQSENGKMGRATVRYSVVSDF